MSCSNDLCTSDPQFIWHSDRTAADLPVDWCVFSLDVKLDNVPRSATIHLFAATHYRLWVNDVTVGYGPARYVPGYEEFDSYDIASHLRAGDNDIHVEACLVHVNNYQSMPEPAGRFVAWGRIMCTDGAAFDLATPGRWRARYSDARSPAAPCFSFAIGPVEVLDLNRLAGDAPMPPVVIDTDRKASDMQPRSISYGDDAAPRTPRLLHAAKVRDDQTNWGFVSLDAERLNEGKKVKRGKRFRYATFIHSDMAQSVSAGLHWGPHFLNGRLVEATNDPIRGNRQNAMLDLHAGWNLLCGEPEQLQALQPLLIALSADAGLSLRSQPNLQDTHTFRYEPPRYIPADERWEAHPACGSNDLTDDCRFIRSQHNPPCPARMVSWDPVDPADWKAVNLPYAVPDDATTWTAVFDCEREYLGRVIVDIDAPAGCVVDVSYDEHLRGDGALALFHGNPFIEATDRYICRAGRQRIETFHPRGGRYLQVTVRRPNTGEDRVLSPITLHGVQVRSASCRGKLSGSFECDDSLLNWTWRTGIDTVEASVEDAFCDSPWRERGTYLGDAYVHSMTLLSLSADHRMSRRCLRLFAQGQWNTGQVPGVVPAWRHDPAGHPPLDFTLLYILWLHDYWARTGDLDIVRECLPTIDRIWASSAWMNSHSLLWDTREQCRSFIDWTAPDEVRACDENGVLNAWRFAALNATAALWAAADNPDRADVFEQQAKAVRQAYQQRLWIASAGCFARGTCDGHPIEIPSLHANVLALAYGLADDRQQPQVAAYVVEQLRMNAQRLSGSQPKGAVEVYFLKFALQALVRIDRHDIAEQIIRDHYGVMREHGAWAFWEALHWGLRGQGSMCHVWSSAPMDYFCRYVLGVREKIAGNPDCLVIDPRVHSIHHARGVAPHPLGPIHVRWERRDDGSLAIEADGPSGVVLEVAGKPAPVILSHVSDLQTP